MPSDAPLYSALAQAPSGGAAYWCTAQDGVRIRVGVWPEGRNGTVLVLPGRTEYIERYGRDVAELARRGYASVVIDWRGQGLSERLLPDPRIGHVTCFKDYQHDLDAAVDLARSMALPEPYFLLAHSMGGCIAMRALLNGLEVRKAAFIAPMWDIALPLLARVVLNVLFVFGRGTAAYNRLTPFTQIEPYLLNCRFEKNALTSDHAMWEYVRAQLKAHPELGLGGPSLSWLDQALRECAWLAQCPCPDIPAFTTLGEDDRVIKNTVAIKKMAQWPGSTLKIYPAGLHALSLEKDAIRDNLFETMDAFFSGQP